MNIMLVTNISYILSSMYNTSVHASIIYFPCLSKCPQVLVSVRAPPWCSGHETSDHWLVWVRIPLVYI